ncbi:gluconate 2-dehydrogenase subunit 3 family protein [Myxococcota bacterium]|nr:gluconate 2-dehydrogenase subunit 3 family protein [Myxococcota bacterium]
MSVSRRRLLQLGLGGSAVLAAGGGLRWFALGYSLAPGERAVSLGTKELAIARALVETLCPADGDLPSGVSLGVHLRFDEEAWASSASFRDDLVAALGVLEHCPPLFGRWARFTGLDLRAREEVFRRMLSSERDVLAKVAFALKQMVHAFYWAREETWPASGYDGTWIVDAKPPASAVRYRELVARGRTS